MTGTGVEATIGPPQPNDWVMSNQIATGTGKLVGKSWENLGGFNLKGNGTAVFTGVGRCPNRIPVSTGPRSHAIPVTQAALQRCIDSFHLRQVITYQPASRYWPLQLVGGGNLRRRCRCPDCCRSLVDPQKYRLNQCVEIVVSPSVDGVPHSCLRTGRMQDRTTQPRPQVTSWLPTGHAATELSELPPR